MNDETSYKNDATNKNDKESLLDRKTKDITPDLESQVKYTGQQRFEMKQCAKRKIISMVV